MAKDINSSLQIVLVELARLQGPDVLAKMPPGLPLLIPTASGGSFIVNEKIDGEIQAVADRLLDKYPQAKRQYSLKEWRTTVRNAFRSAFSQIGTGEPFADGARKLGMLVESALDPKKELIASLFTSMGCTLLAKPLVTPLGIGPVRFESKTDWLARAEQTRQITGHTRKRLTDAFAGHRLRKLKNKRMELFDEHILGVLGDSQMVFTVEAQHLSAQLSEERAIIGARLAQMALAILWRTPSRTLEGFHLSVDHGSRKIETVPFIYGRFIIGGSRTKGWPHGPSMPTPEWEDLIKDAKGLLAIAGRLIECWTSVTAYDNAQPILRSLAQGLHFYWEGCRDENHLMAIVKFTAVLEALAPPGKSAGIKRLIKARLGVKEGVKFVGDRDLDEVVTWLYSTSGAAPFTAQIPKSSMIGATRAPLLNS